MISQQELAGSWGQLKGKIKEKWGQITEDELTRAEGNVEQVIGMIQRKTGTARREIEEFFEQTIADSTNLAKRAAANAQQYARQASDAVSEGFGQMADQVHQGYEQAEELIRNRPAESLSVAFGAGIITGILVTLMMRSTR